MRLKTIADVREANNAIGNFFFERDTMRFFHSRIESALYNGRFFITSETPEPGEIPRTYSVREALPTGEIVLTPDSLKGIRSIHTARDTARELAYPPKNERVWIVQGLYGSQYGWEDETAETKLSEIRERLKEYRENGTGVPYRIISRMEPIR